MNAPWRTGEIHASVGFACPRSAQKQTIWLRKILDPNVSSSLQRGGKEVMPDFKDKATFWQRDGSPR
eukprot:10553132-Karenia_brevis.AAC.1